MITYRERYAANRGESEWGREIACATPEEEKISAFYLSPDAFGKRGSANTAAEQIEDGMRAESGYRIPAPAPADTDRVGGARLMHQLIESDSWEISSACEMLIECLPTLIHDEEPRHEDVLKIDATETTLGDDPYDSARYGLKSYLSPGTKPKEIRAAKRIEAEQKKREEKGLPRVTDPHSIAMMSMKAEADEAKKHRLVPLISPRRLRGNWRHRRGPL